MRAFVIMTKKKTLKAKGKNGREGCCLGQKTGQFRKGRRGRGLPASPRKGGSAAQQKNGASMLETISSGLGELGPAKKISRFGGEREQHPRIVRGRNRNRRIRRNSV